MFQNNCTIIGYNIVQTFSSSSTRFGLFRPSSGRYSTKKNTIMARFFIVKHVCDIIDHYFVFFFLEYSLKMAETCRRTTTCLCVIVYN